MMDLFAIVLTLLAVPAAGLAVGEVFYRIENLVLRKEIRKAEAEHKAHLRSRAVEFAQTTHGRHLSYIARDASGRELLRTNNAAIALDYVIGMQGATVHRDGRLVLRNRTLVQGGGK